MGSYIYRDRYTSRYIYISHGFMKSYIKARHRIIHKMITKEKKNFQAAEEREKLER